MDKKVALHFRDEFRKARDSALKDAEGYQQILFVLERMGSYLLKKKGDLGKYKCCISKLVKQNCPSFVEPSDDCHINFNRLFDMVRVGRNDALHQGAVARMMTSHSVQLSMMIEDTLMAVVNSQRIGDYMARVQVRSATLLCWWETVSSGSDKHTSKGVDGTTGVRGPEGGRSPTGGERTPVKLARLLGCSELANPHLG